MHPGADSATFRHLAYTVNCSGRSFECVDCGVMNGDSLEGRAFCHLFQRGKDDTPNFAAWSSPEDAIYCSSSRSKPTQHPPANNENVNWTGWTSIACIRKLSRSFADNYHKVVYTALEESLLPGRIAQLFKVNQSLDGTEDRCGNSIW